MMIDRWIAEATECDFKVALEVKKPKSWLKSVSAFANGIGGTLFFGIDDDRNVIGLSDAQIDAETISRLIKERITPAIPEALLGCFDEPLVLTGECKRLLVTIGQFSIVRLERDTQLLIPTFDYCVPSKTCPPVGGASTESPCDVFSQIEFPMDAFFPGKNEPCIKPEDSCTGCSRTK